MMQPGAICQLPRDQGGNTNGVPPFKLTLPLSRSTHSPTATYLEAINTPCYLILACRTYVVPWKNRAIVFIYPVKPVHPFFGLIDHHFHVSFLFSHRAEAHSCLERRLYRTPVFHKMEPSFRRCYGASDTALHTSLNQPNSIVYRFALTSYLPRWPACSLINVKRVQRNNGHDVFQEFIPNDFIH